MSVFTIFFFSLEETGEKEFLGEVGKLEGKGKKITIRIKRNGSWKGRGGLKERGGEKHSAAGFGVVECEGKFRDMLLRMPPKGATEIQAKRAFK